MKRLLFALLMLGILAGVSAQTVKLGYVDTDRVLYESNEAREIERLFNLDKQNWTNQVRQLDEQIKRMEQDFEIDKLTKNETAKREAQARINEKKAEAGRLLQEYFGEGGRAEQRYRELIDPLTAKVQRIIQKIAEDEKYTMVFDSSYPILLYAAPSIDLTQLVLQELNKDTVRPTDTGTPAPNASNPPITPPASDKPDEIKPPVKP